MRSIDPGLRAEARRRRGHFRIQQTPREILDVMHSPAPPTAVPSPTRDRLLLVSQQEYPSIARVATPYLRLAGVRLEPGNQSRHDTPGGYGIAPCASSIHLVRIADGAQDERRASKDSCARHFRWSADGERFAFENVSAESVELWVADAKSGAVRRIQGVRINPMLDDEMDWMPDQKHLLVKLVPAGRGQPPKRPSAPPGPSIQEATGQKGQSSTYETRDTLESPYDEDLFDYYAASQLAIVDVVTAPSRPSARSIATYRWNLPLTARTCSSRRSRGPIRM
jgi:dipeptidyl aminopeptidase/acylaminoacyl peptidase